MLPIPPFNVKSAQERKKISLCDIEGLRGVEIAGGPEMVFSLGLFQKEYFI